ncbi:MAG: two-component system, sensor histidine kinase and response regulator, partial [Actinomycetota bacterium]|nr:two-component system, sensor histidine kinase and response regulator [Actinomycetota bacterium]
PRSVGFPLNHVPMSAFLGVPIKFGDELRGALYLTKPPGHGSFTAQDEFFMMTLASQTSVALETAHLIAELEEQRAITQLLERVAVASNEAHEIDHALQTAVDAICGHTAWPIGHVYLPHPGDPDLLEPTKIWHLRDPDRFAEFVEITERTSVRRGVGLPGRVLEAGTAIWVEDVTVDENFPRASQAIDIGVRAGFGLPVMAESEVVGVLEFFIPETRQRDDNLLEVGTFIGTQLGRVIERKRIEEGMHALDKAKSEFVANAAHELRTPLTTILGLTELISNPKRVLDEAQFGESISLLKRQGERVGALLTNLLDYSRIEVRSDPGDLEVLDLAGAVQEAIEAAPAPDGYAVRSQVPGGLLVWADPVRLEQVIVNLLTNAYRYGGRTVTVAAETSDSGVVLKVSDDGAGIEPKLIPHLFEPFTRGSTTQSITGSGLGLAIVKRLVETFGGRIVARNQEDGGAVFEVYLRKSSK